MIDKKIVGFLVLITILSLGFSFYTVHSSREQINIPIDALEALDIVKNEPAAHQFIAENFGLPEDRIERVALTWEPEKETYVWDIEIQERSCGCMLDDIEGVTILKASVNPFTGEIYNLSSRVGVPEEQIKREACEKGCHVG